MKRFLLTVVALFVAVGVFASGMFPDVPEKHWAYEYVKHLKDKGIVIGYPDGTFKGDRNITRYEEAAMISRLIGLIETEIVGPYISDVLKVLDAISVKLGSTIEKVDAVEKKVAELQQMVGTHEQDVFNLFDSVSKLQKKHSEDIARLNDEMDAKLAEQKEEFEAVISKLEGKIANLDKKLLALEPVKNIVADLTSYTRAQSNRITALENQVGDLSAMLDNAVKTLGYVSIKLDRLSEKVDSISNKVSANESEIANLKESTAGLAKSLEELKQTVNIHDKDIFNLYESIAKLEKKHNEDVAKLNDAISSKTSELESKLNEFQATHDEQINYVLDELDSVNTQLSELRDGLFAIREDSEARFQTVTKSIDDTKAELLKKIDELSKANAALTGAVIGAIILAVAAMIVGAM
ncbi:MAG: S-layer homology domain-containing protein [Thermotoga caldifontis]|uniref:S-layer homology domain-containing protein n=1 Tax=Thermotoga caldifontis TaxID=1508419 RepID=UPI003C7DB225